MKRFALHTLGCKVNQFESDCILERFAGRGWTIVPFVEAAEMYLVNTCAVTAEAQRQSAQMLRSALRRQPEARVGAVGCAVQVYPDYFKKIEGLQLLRGNRDKIDTVLQWAFGVEEGPSGTGSFGTFKPERLSLECPLPEHRSRAFFRIQEGCNSACTYCLVPRARGRSRSLPPGDVVIGIKRLADRGIPEVILTGIHLGQYGRDLEPPLDLGDLLERILAESRLPQIRLSSLEMGEVSPELIALVRKDPRLCPHLHIPLQSGDDRLLRAMNRPYTTGDYGRLIHRVRSEIPAAALGADVIVGFPGEDEASFERSEKFLAGLPLSYLHVFPFSPRPGTPAADFPDQVPAPVRKERARRLRELDRTLRRRFVRENLESVRTAVVLGEGKNREGRALVLTDNYLNVQVRGLLPAGLPVRIRISGTRGAELIGIALETVAEYPRII